MSPLYTGFDLYTSSIHPNIIPPNSHKQISTGIALQRQPNMFGLISPRSGLALHKSIDVAEGVIDPDYTEDIKAILVNHSNIPFKIKLGNRISQIIFYKIS